MVTRAPWSHGVAELHASPGCDASSIWLQADPCDVTFGRAKKVTAVLVADTGDIV